MSYEAGKVTNHTYFFSEYGKYYVVVVVVFYHKNVHLGGNTLIHRSRITLVHVNIFVIELIYKTFNCPSMRFWAPHIYSWVVNKTPARP